MLGLALANEGGHFLAASMLHLRWKRFVRLPWKFGIAVDVDTPRHARLIGLAGPSVNLAIAAPPLAFPGQPRALGVVSVFIATVASAFDWTVVRGQS
jgi:hypothetical protein